MEDDGRRRRMKNEALTSPQSIITCYLFALFVVDYVSSLRSELHKMPLGPWRNNSDTCLIFFYTSFFLPLIFYFNVMTFVLTRDLL